MVWQLICLRLERTAEDGENCSAHHWFLTPLHQEYNKLSVPTECTPGQTVHFRKLLLNHCQKEFKMGLDVEEKNIELVTCSGEQQQSVKDTDIRMVGIVKFIGQLFQLKMLTEAIMHDCIVKLLKAQSEESLVCVCVMLYVTGKDLDFDKAKPRMDQYFNLINKIIKEKQTSNRIRFMLQDVIDLRQANWVRHGDPGPQTIANIRKQAMEKKMGTNRRPKSNVLEAFLNFQTLPVAAHQETKTRFSGQISRFIPPLAPPAATPSLPPAIVPPLLLPRVEPTLLLPRVEPPAEPPLLLSRVAPPAEPTLLLPRVEPPAEPPLLLSRVAPPAEPTLLLPRVEPPAEPTLLLPRVEPPAEPTLLLPRVAPPAIVPPPLLLPIVAPPAEPTLLLPRVAPPAIVPPLLLPIVAPPAEPTLLLPRVEPPAEPTLLLPRVAPPAEPTLLLPRVAPPAEPTLLLSRVAPPAEPTLLLPRVAPPAIETPLLLAPPAAVAPPPAAAPGAAGVWSVPPLEDDLSCPVCCDIYTDPVVLPCSHSFCRPCLERSWREKGVRQECLICRQKTTAHNPTPNLALRNVCEAYLKERSAGTPLTESDFNNTETHLVQALCPEHGEKLQFYCQDEDQLVCVECVTQEHKTHAVCSAKKAAHERKDELKCLIKSLEDDVKKNKTLIEEVMAHIKAQAAQTETQIKEEFEKLHQFLRREEEARIAALREEERDKTANLEEKMEAIERVISSLSERMKPIEKLMETDEVSFLQKFS
ncbi:uncharacterized protein LOC143124068 isoform X2 [Alosa pseudoharengus]|uniref:uncharacterized protein LOC143124068 isoform X2 n=1 Tax=Alosa pseudoharengus TaxID=34774 RepID=UPI003F8AAF90